MDVSVAILKRTTVRKWSPSPVEKEKIEKVLEAGRRAPSWGNTQPWRFIVIQDRTRIEEIAKAGGGQPQATTAPVLIVCCGSSSDFSRKLHGDALKQLRDAGVMDASDDFLDNVLLKNDLFAPYLLGDQIMTIKAGEQIMIAVAYMTLEAVNQGLGTCWVGAISPKNIHKALNLPDSLFVHTLLSLGYPGEDNKPRPRKEASKIIFWEKYA
jgi:nitroreductase